MLIGLTVNKLQTRLKTKVILLLLRFLQISRSHKSVWLRQSQDFDTADFVLFHGSERGLYLVIMRWNNQPWSAVQLVSSIRTYGLRHVTGLLLPQPQHRSYSSDVTGAVSLCQISTYGYPTCGCSDSRHTAFSGFVLFPEWMIKDKAFVREIPEFAERLLTAKLKEREALWSTNE